MINVPFFHIHAWGAPWSYVLRASRIVLPGRFTPEVFCELVQTEKVTSTGLVSTMLAMLIEYPDLKKWDLSSLQEVGVGGGALPKGLKTKAEALLPGLTATSGYGMTETNAGVIRASMKRYMVDWPKEKLDDIWVKTGLPLFGIEAMVVDENGEPVPQDDETVGEIVLRGNWITEQYFKDPERTATAWRDGWFHTGDAAKVNSEDYITIVDRITDVIRSGAEMVPTVLLENLTATADFVLEATYVGVPDEKWGERPMALVRMLPDFIAFVDEIPKTSVGKFDKIATRKKLDEFLAKAKRIREL
jgi:acyl-CoA synthetase (AMP-forming)/AMP-acid ligase II